MRAQAISGPTSSEQLDLLDQYLRSERAPPTCMFISQLDGFLTGIAAGPEGVPASEWLTRIWGGAEPTFSDAEEKAAVLETIMRRYNEIARGLEHCLVDPIYLTGSADTPDASHWVTGFLDGIRLRRDAWKPLLTSASVVQVFSPILAVALGEQGEPLVELPAEEKDDALHEAAILIPACVAAIAGYWRVVGREKSRRSWSASASVPYTAPEPYVAAQDRPQRTVPLEAVRRSKPRTFDQSPIGVRTLYGTGSRCAARCIGCSIAA